jgi:ribosomal protein S18 acetylase RimI-like enzyme
MQVRPVRPDEYAKAGELVVAAYRALPGSHMSEDYAAELADVERRAAGAEVLVAAEETLVGCVTYVPDASSQWAEMLGENEAGIRMLAVVPEAQGRGVGRALVAECVAKAKNHGRTALMLHTTPWMLAAQRVYDQAGFVRLPERDWTPAPGVPLLAYRLAIAPTTD